MIRIYYMGLSTECNRRVWGYFREEIGAGGMFIYDYYVFWGHKDGSLMFRQRTDNARFYKEIYKKKKRYQEVDLTDVVEEQFSEFKIIRILKTGH